MRSEEDDININRWLVTDQDSPLFTDQKEFYLGRLRWILQISLR